MAKRMKKPQPNASSPLLLRLLVVGLTLAVIGGVVFGIAWLGDAARRGIGPRDRYLARFADIECNTPPGFDRVTFLSEVRYISNFPESFHSLDPELNAKLTAAFTAHPWVAALEGVSVNTEGHITVKLKFRVPVLAVKTDAGNKRVVDASAVLLPLEASSEGLPELLSVLPSPSTPAGKPWASDVVKRATELAEAHHPRTLEKRTQGWRLTMPDGKTLSVEK
jgi:hypothetical protein